MKSKYAATTTLIHHVLKYTHTHTSVHLYICTHIHAHACTQDLIPRLQAVAAERTRLSPDACSGLEQAVPAQSLPGLPPLSLARLMLSIAAAGGACMSQVGTHNCAGGELCDDLEDLEWIRCV